MNIHDSLLSHETLSQVIKVPLIASWHIKLYGGLAWLGYMRAAASAAALSAGLRQWPARAASTASWSFMPYLISQMKSKWSKSEWVWYQLYNIVMFCGLWLHLQLWSNHHCRRRLPPAGDKRHASLVVRQNHDPNGQCRGEPGNEIHRRAAAFARRPKLYIPITIRSQINLVPLLCLSRQGSTEHFYNFEKKSWVIF